MILDKGICSVFRKVNSAGAGGMPVPSYQLVHQSWYAELTFETYAARPTPNREDVRTDSRIRVHQNRDINNHDVVVFGEVREVAAWASVYEVTRAYHGTDAENGQPISDLSLVVMEP